MIKKLLPLFCFVSFGLFLIFQTLSNNSDNKVIKNLSIKVDYNKLYPILSPHTKHSNSKIIFFFASWCKHCKPQIEQLRLLKQKYKFSLDGVIYHDKPNDIIKYLGNGHPFDNVYIISDDYLASMGVYEIPTFFVLNKKNEVILKANLDLNEENFLNVLYSELK